MEEYAGIDTIGEHIKSRHHYTVPELAPHLGVSPSAIYRLIAKGDLSCSMRKIGSRRVKTVLGSSALAFCKTHEQYLALFSTYGGRTRIWRTPKKPVNTHPWPLRPATVRERAEKKAQELEETGFEIFRVCRQLLEQHKKITMRRVQGHVPVRMQVICRFVREWKEDMRLHGIA